MGKGILSGVIWGAVVGGISTAFLSLYVPMQKATVAQRAESESVEPVAPSAVESAEATESTASAAPVETAETAESETAEVTPTEPVVTEPAVAETPSTAEVTAVTEGASEAPSEQAEVVQAEEVAPTVSEPTETASAVGTQVADQPKAEKPEVTVEIAAAPAAPSAPATPSVALPSISSQSDPETATAAEPKRLKAPEVNDRQLGQVVSPAALTTPETTEEPDAETASADTPIAVPLPKIESPTKVVTNRLPSVTAPTEEPAESDATESAEEGETPAEIDPNAGALERFAAEAEIPEGASLFSIVLVDAGADGMARDKLLALDLPVTFAIDPAAEGAASAMAAYRGAGFEVVAIPDDLPVAASPSDVEVALGGYFEVLSEAVGVMDPLDGRIQSNRSLLQPVLGAIRDSGHGLLTYDRGLNTAQQAARRENIPAASVYRILDAELEKAPLIKRYLDRAAFTANKDGSVVVVGRSYEDTVTALIEWGLARKDGDLAIVPVSAVMKVGAQ